MNFEKCLLFHFHTSMLEADGNSWKAKISSSNLGMQDTAGKPPVTPPGILSRILGVWLRIAVLCITFLAGFGLLFINGRFRQWFCAGFPPFAADPDANAPFAADPDAKFCNGKTFVDALHSPPGGPPSTARPSIPSDIDIASISVNGVTAKRLQTLQSVDTGTGEGTNGYLFAVAYFLLNPEYRNVRPTAAICNELRTRLAAEARKYFVWDRIGNLKPEIVNAYADCIRTGRQTADGDFDTLRGLMNAHLSDRIDAPRIKKIIDDTALVDFQIQSQKSILKKIKEDSKKVAARQLLATFNAERDALKGGAPQVEAWERSIVETKKALENFCERDPFIQALRAFVKICTENMQNLNSDGKTQNPRLRATIPTATTALAVDQRRNREKSSPTFSFSRRIKFSMR